MITIQSRFNQIADESSSTGQKLTQWYEEQGIAVKNQDGSMRSLYDVLQDVAEIWEEIDPIARTNYLNWQAGANQTNNLNAALENFTHVAAATETALDSLGSAEHQNSVYMESLEAQTNILKATFQELANDVIPRDLIAGALSALTTVLEGLDSDLGVFMTRWALLVGVASGAIGIIVPLVSGLFAVLTSPAGAAIIALAGVVAVIFDIKDAVDKANPSVEELSDSIQTDTAKLETNRQRLEELNAIPWQDRTDDIQAEIAKLEAENRLLERNIALEAEKALKTTQKVTTGYQWQFEAPAYAGGPGYDAGPMMTMYADSAEDALSRISELYGENAEAADLAIQAMTKLATTETMTAAEASKVFAEALHNTTNGLQDQTQFIKDNEEAIVTDVNMYKALQAQGYALTEAQQALVHEWDLYNSTLADNLEQTDEIVEGQEELAEANNLAAESLRELDAEIELNSDLVEELIEKYPELASVIGESDGAYQANIANLLAMADEAGYTSEEIMELINSIIASTGTQMDTSGSQAMVSALSNLLYALINDTDAATAAISAFNSVAGGSSVSSLVGTPIKTKSSGGGGGGGSSSSNARQTALNNQKTQMQQILAYYKDVADKALDDINEKIDAINAKYDDEIDALEETNDELEKQLELEEALKNLETARAKQVLVFQDGRFQYMGDVDSVSAAQRSLNEYNRKRDLEERKKYLEEKRKLELEELEAEKVRWEEYKLGLSDLTSAYEIEQGELLAIQQDGAALENQTWEERIANLQAFRNQYVSIASELASIGAIGGSGGGGSGSSNFVTTPSGSKVSKEQIQKLVDYIRGTDDAQAQAAAETLRKLGYTNAEIWGPIANGTYTFAKGTTDAPGGLSLVGENGPEMRVLGSHEGILPAEITKNLWQWGSMTPKDFMQSKGGGDINIGNITLPNVSNAEQFVSGLKNLAMQRAYRRI